MFIYMILSKGAFCVEEGLCFFYAQNPQRVGRKKYVK